MGRFPLVLLLLIQGPSFAAPTTPRTLCQQDEQVLFSCPVRAGTTIVSLCGAPNLTAKDGYLQYRFGHAGKVELAFPPQQRDTQPMFRYAHYSRYQVDRMTVSFEKNGYTYTLFDAYEGDVAPQVHQQGVQVSLRGAGRKEITFLCRGAATGNLRSLMSIVPCDKHAALNMGECR